MRALAAVLILMSALAACDTAVDSDVGPPPAPDAAPVEGTLDNVNALFARSCAGAPCHVNTATPASGLDLTAETLCASVVGVDSNDAPGNTLIVSGDPDNSYLLCKMLEDCTASGSLMPLGAVQQLPDVGTVSAWIADGTPGCP